VKQLKALPAQSLIYVDETGIEQWLYREYARAPRGEKVFTKISGRKFKRTNIVAGICQGRWIAPLVYCGTTDSALVEYWFEHCLLKDAKSKSTIILDNATFHRKSVLPKLAKKHNCRILFLPPYSPELNLIEHKWAWLKKKLRSLLPVCNSFDDAVWNIFQVG
jgi:transposase